jgi:hypothetical protein
LVQEQQSKAKIIGEFLFVRRQVDEKRAAREVLDRELRKARSILEDERARRTSAQEGLNRLQTEVEQWRQEHQQLQELREEHAALEANHQSTEAEHNKLLTSVRTLEASQEHGRMDLQRASSDDQRVRSQMSESQARLQQANERTESLQNLLLDVRQAVGTTQESLEKLKRELCSERGLREQLEDEAALLRADTDHRWHGQRAAKEALLAAELQQSELQSQIAKCGDEAASLRQKSKEAREKLANDRQAAEHLRAGGCRFVEALRAFGDSWFRGLSDGSHSPARALDSRGVVHNTPVEHYYGSGKGAAMNVVASVKSVVPAEESSHVEVSDVAAVSNGGAESAVSEQLLPTDCPLKAEIGSPTCGKALLPKPSQAVMEKDEGVRPPVPLWDASGYAASQTGRPADSTSMATEALRGQQHGMASLMVGSQDSPPVLPPGAAVEEELGSKADVHRLLKLDALVPDLAAMQRMASASILTLVTPPPKRPMPMQLSPAGGKRLRAR